MRESLHAEAQYRAIIAHAWLGMLVVLIIDLISDLWELLLLQTSYEQLTESLHGAAGLPGLWFLAGLTCISFFFQVAIRTLDGPSFRKSVYLASKLYLGILVLHQIISVTLGERLGFHTIFDLTQDGLGLWACWASNRWWRLALADAQSGSSRFQTSVEGS